MILLGLLYHLYLYVFGFELTKVHMASGDVFVIPEPYQRVKQTFTRGLQSHEFVPAYTVTARANQVWLNPYQFCVLAQA